MGTAPRYTASGNTFAGPVPGGGTPTCDITVQGANGRDQAAAFPAGSKVNFFEITGQSPTPNALIASLSAGPTLPTGYIAAGRIVPLMLKADGTGFRASTIISVSSAGGGTPVLVTYDNAITDAIVLNAGTASGTTPTTSIDISSFVPSDADFVTLEFGGLANSGGAQSTQYLGYVSGKTFAYLTEKGGQYDSSVVQMPSNNSGVVYYNNGTTGDQTYLYVMGYQIGV